MNLLRPRYAALATAAYFAIIAYFAWDTARTTTGPWYDAAASQIVYQTSLVGGVLLLAGLFVVASIRPRLPASQPRGRMASKLLTSRQATAASRPGEVSDDTAPAPNDADWSEVEEFLDALPGAQPSGDAEMIRIQSTETPAATPLGPAPMDGSQSTATLTDRLSEIRARSTVVVYPEGRDTTRMLSGLIAEVRPLLRAARRAGLNGREMRRMVSDPLASQEADLAQRVRLVEHMKETLESALVARIGEDLQDVLVSIQLVNDAADRARKAELTAAEAITLLDTGNYQVAIDRVERARELVRARAGFAEALRTKASGRSSWLALAGPAIGAVGYVAVSSMLLPGYAGFVQTNFRLNTTAILMISYGWAGLLTYALTSVYMTLRPASEKA